MTAGDLSTFVIYALFVGGNVGAIAGVISQLIQVRRAIIYSTLCIYDLMCTAAVILCILTFQGH